MKRNPLKGLLGALLLAFSTVSFAAIDTYAFETAVEEARYKALIDELRCPKCLNTNLSGSDSPISADLRRTVATMVQEGKGDEEIREYLLARYGDFILYRPRVMPATYVLWFGPALLFLLALAVVVRLVLRQRQVEAPAPLSPDEQAALARLSQAVGEKSKA
ncbi:MAG: cytochrome c-type biogenesis protein CcmH [Pseudomonadales bacterium]|nr:cytochrome c-type biogenesis protein CcmH [Pseudomonadales bacterium]